MPARKKTGRVLENIIARGYKILRKLNKSVAVDRLRLPFYNTADHAAAHTELLRQLNLIDALSVHEVAEAFPHGSGQERTHVSLHPFLS